MTYVRFHHHHPVMMIVMTAATRKGRTLGMRVKRTTLKKKETPKKLTMKMTTIMTGMAKQITPRLFLILSLTIATIH